ncbi:MAG: NAD-dependent epimerase/dehydratase family protein [Chloroflexota bacterium]|nr:NAD-dependent epimerase/dehydratase family protein [Chloroflexota bacterium]
MPHSEQRIVVTGGAGFIGSHLVDRLLESGDAAVVVLDNLSRGRISNLAQHRDNRKLQLIEGDLRNPADLAGAMRDASVVYHLAAQATVIGGVRDMVYTFDTNVVGTFNVLRAASHARVARVLFASSREVYGEPINLPVDEDSPLQAINSFGVSKVAGEAYCRAFRRELGLQVSILRLADVYGPRDVGRVVPLWIDQAIAGHDLDVYGGKQVLDLVWVETVVEAMVRATALNITLPPTNIGSGTGTRIVDLARRIARLGCGQPRLRLLPARPMDVTRFVANVDRMRQILGLEPALDPLANLPAMISTPVGA